LHSAAFLAGLKADFIRIAAVAALAVSLRSTNVQPHPTRADVDPLFGHAYTVVLGHVTRTRTLSEERLPGPYMAIISTESIDLDVDRCYKPSDGCGATLTFIQHHTGINDPEPWLTKGERIIAFFQESGRELKPLNGFSIWRVDWLTPSGESRKLSGEALLETDLASGLNSIDPALHFESLHWLQGFRQLTPEVALRLRNIVDSQSTRFDERLSALATLLRDPKPEYFAIAAKMAQTQPQTVMLYYPGAASEVKSALQRVKNSEALPSLVAILDSNVEIWHEPAMYAIRAMQDPKTIPLLIKGLDDPDREAAYHALAALAIMTHKGGDFGPGGLAFERDPEKYVQVWKHWRETKGEAELGSVSMPRSPDIKFVSHPPRGSVRLKPCI
jgi:hypothetical protein